jgi:hypothetical protein
MLPINGPTGLSRVTPPAGSDAGDIRAFVSELAASEGMLTLAASRSAPPPEVLDQIAAAARIDEQLRESGQQLHFSPAEPGERPGIEIHDRQGNAVRTLTVAEAVEIAAGRPLG